MLDNEPPGRVEIPTNVVDGTDVDRVLGVVFTGNEDTEGELSDRDEDEDEAGATLGEVTGMLNGDGNLENDISDVVPVTEVGRVEVVVEVSWAEELEPLMTKVPVVATST